MEPSADAAANPAGGVRYSTGQRLALLGLNSLTLLQVGLVLGLAFAPWPRLWEGAVSALGFLYLVPPIAARLILFVFPMREGKIPLGSREFLIWWALFNLQMIYARVPVLEEILRIVPGLYSMWLRLWGAKIGRLAYWGAGVRIFDRSFLHIGRDVVFGAGVRLSPHAFLRSREGEMELQFATIRVGDRALVGGYSLLSPGTEIAADECTHAFLICQPFVSFKDGRRHKSSGDAGPPDRFLDWLQR